MDWDRYFQNENRDTRKVAAMNMLMVMTADGNVDEREKQHFVQRLSEASNRSEALEDLIWVLVNSSEMAWNH